MLQIKVNGAKTIECNVENGQYFLGGQKVDFDISRINEHEFHIIYKNKSFNAFIVGADYENKKFKLKVEGNIYELEVKDQFDQLLEKMGINKGQENKLNEVKAPMPGLIISINVAEGQEVEQGEPLLILEAMKMENVIKSPGKGLVKEIKVGKGETVEKNQVLIRF